MEKTIQLPVNKLLKGFTLVEMLLVVTLIGALAGITLSVINPTLLNNRSEDGVSMGNMAKLQYGLETYETVEGRYPDSIDLDAPGNTLLRSYVTDVPEDDYDYWVSDDKHTMGIVLPMETTTATVYKYYSGWGEIRICSSVGDSGDPDSDVCN